MRKHADYIYRNKRDTIRVRIFKQIDNEEKLIGWDYDFTSKHDGRIRCQSDGSADLFDKKSEALEAANRAFGPLKAINPEYLQQGWN
jgi:hypothetical protein